MGNQDAYQTRASMSYVTGSHNFKVGMQTMTGDNEIRDIAPLYRTSTSSGTSAGRRSSRAPIRTASIGG